LALHPSSWYESTLGPAPQDTDLPGSYPGSPEGHLALSARNTQKPLNKPTSDGYTGSIEPAKTSLDPSIEGWGELLNAAVEMLGNRSLNIIDGIPPGVFFEESGDASRARKNA
jgi:hypothetical protein